MNEQELKNIWRREEKIPLKNIDMEFISQQTGETQNILNKLSNRELIFGLTVSAIYVFDFIWSGNFYFVLAGMILVWIYIFWRKHRDIKLDNLERNQDVRNFLIEKEKTLRRELKTNQILIVVIVPTFYILTKILHGSVSELLADPVKYIVVLMITTIFVWAFSEFYNRRNYVPVLEDLRYLIEQFEEDK